MVFELPIPGWDAFTVSIIRANWPWRKGMKRAWPRYVPCPSQGPFGEIIIHDFRWMWLRITWYRV